MLIEAPFLVLAVLLPFAEGGQRIDVAGLQLSVTGPLRGVGHRRQGHARRGGRADLAATTSATELPQG